MYSSWSVWRRTTLRWKDVTIDVGTTWERSAPAATCTPTPRPSTRILWNRSRTARPSEFFSYSVLNDPIPSTRSRMRGSSWLPEIRR